MNTNNDKLSRKNKVVELPMNTGAAILEAASEEDSDCETPVIVGDSE